MPTSRPSLLPSSVIGTPEMLYFFIRSSASKIRWVGESVIGSTIMPLSERLTRSTSEACSSIVRFLWITPRPPCCAIAIASRDSVTVSIAALSSGTLSRMLRVSWVETSTCGRHDVGVARHEQDVVEGQGGGEAGVDGEERRRFGGFHAAVP